MSKKILLALLAGLLLVPGCATNKNLPEEPNAEDVVEENLVEDPVVDEPQEEVKVEEWDEDEIHYVRTTTTLGEIIHEEVLGTKNGNEVYALLCQQHTGRTWI